MVDDGADTQRGAAVGSSASAIDGARAGPCCSAARSTGSALLPLAYIRLAYTLLHDSFSAPGVPCWALSTCMRMLSRGSTHADVSEPLPPTEDVLSGMDENFHPNGGPSEGKLAAAPTWPPTFVLRANADAGCYLDVRAEASERP